MFDSPRCWPTPRTMFQLAVTLGSLLLFAACGGEGSGNNNVTPSAAPTGLDAQAGDAQVSLTWRAAEGATGYRVLRSGTSGGPYSPIASPSGTSHTDTGLTNGTTYYYVVRAVNDAGESSSSAEVSATPRAPSTLPAPTNLSATPGNAQVVLNWSASAGATSYEVQRDAGCTGTFTSIATPTATTYTDTGLTNGASYCYVVKARNGASASPPSSQVSVTPEATSSSAPPAPTNLSATPGNAQVVLSWSASAGATSYEVQRDAGCTGTFTSIATPTATTYTDTGLTNGTSYCYIVKAKNGVGTSSPSSQVRATPEAASSSAPAAPTNLSATPGNAQVVLSWNGSTGATGYIVQRATTPGGPYVQAGTPSATTFTDSGLGNSKPYYYVVRATNPGGTSLPSTEVSAVPSSGRELCVTNENSHTVAVFDPTASGNVQPLRRLGDLTGLGNLQAVAFDRVNGEIYVANTASSPYSPAYPVTVYARTASGNIAPVRVISGTSTGLKGAVGIAVDPVNNEVFVSAAGAIRVFSRTANGNVAPLRTLNICAGCAPGIAIDPGHGELFVPSGNSITIYARTAQGNATPSRTLSGSFTELSSPTSVAYDAVHDEIITTSSNSAIGVFPRTASGNAFPTRTIYADVPANLTGLTYAAVDDASGDIYVASTTSVAVFPRTADQGATPSRTIAGANVGFTRPLGIAVNPANGEVFIGDGSARRLVVHSTTANGNVAPLRTTSGLSSGVDYPTGIAAALGAGKLLVSNSGTASVTSYVTPWTGTPTPATTLRGAATALGTPGAIAVDEAHGEMFVTNAPSADTVTVYALGSDGNTAPVRTLAGNLTGLSGPYGIAMDPTNNELFVANNAKTITVYGRTAGGNVAPVRTLGPSSVLGFPVGIAVDVTNNELVVLSSTATASEVLVFARNASGGAAPLRKLSGASTQLAGASDVVVDTARNELLVTNATSSSITVYLRTANGDVAPLRTISGASTLLSQPSGIALCK